MAVEACLLPARGCPRRRVSNPSTLPFSTKPGFLISGYRPKDYSMPVGIQLDTNIPEVAAALSLAAEDYHKLPLDIVGEAAEFAQSQIQGNITQRFSGLPALQDTGTLLNSVTAQVGMAGAV